MSAATIEVSQLRVGMFVHLDLGWMSHPFPLSSFLINHPEQIGTIQSLGLARVRWSPEKSESSPVPLDELPAPREAVGALTPEAIEQAQRSARRAALADQRSALKQCERQYGEATRAWRQATDLIGTQPKEARQRTEALTRAMLDKMLGDRELCIRLLSETAGDRATAHSMNVSVISLLMGKVCGLSEPEMLDLGMGALLHDIGKMELPARVRFHDEQFTSAENNLYREHVAHGVTHGRKMGLTPAALLVIAQHHEQADGSGFPQRLNVDRMTAAARIVSLVNRYDNLCNPTVVAKALTPHEALSLMFAQGKHKFDVTMLNAFIRMMGVYPPGSVVQLTDERYAQVVSVNSARPLKPRVLVHDPKTPREEALYVDLETATGLGIRRSLKLSQLPPASLDYLSPRQRIAYYFEPAPLADTEGADTGVVPEGSTE
jgi:putative nucleotidyltransferase with HDIG domain